MIALNAIDSDRQPTSFEASVGLDTLNRIIESLALKGAYIWSYPITRVTFPSSKLSYTIGGASADLVTDINGGPSPIPRPIKITRANIVVTSNSPAIHMPVTLIDSYEFLGIAVPLVATSIPVKAYVDYGFVSTPGVLPTLATPGLATIYFNPFPAAPLPDFEYTAPVQVTQFADLATTDYIFPPGYAPMLIYWLAEEMIAFAPPEVDMQRVSRLARHYRAMVANNNLPAPPRTGQDVGLGASSDTRQADFNWISGTPY